MSFWKKPGRDGEGDADGFPFPDGPYGLEPGAMGMPPTPDPRMFGSKQGGGPGFEFENFDDLMSFVRENSEMFPFDEDDEDIDVHADYIESLRTGGARTYQMVSSMEMDDIMPRLDFAPGRLMFSPEESTLGMQRTLFLCIGRHRGDCRALTLGMRSDTSVKDVLPEWADLVPEPKMVYAAGPMRSDKLHVVGLLRPGVDEKKWQRRVRGGKVLGNRLVIIDPAKWRDDPSLLDPSELDTDAAGAAYMMNTPGLEDVAVPLPEVAMDPEEASPGRPGLGPSGGMIHAWNQYPDGPFEPYANLSHLPEFRGARREVEGIGTVMAALVFAGHMDGLERIDLNAVGTFDFDDDIDTGWKSWCVVPAMPSDLFLPRGRNLFNNFVHRLPLPFPFLGMINTTSMDN
ncbi:MAG: hypothetical protein Q4G37_02085 [Bifidobacterium sp.]|nr:hypothetical protein [Bifidobacterium sp.]